MCLPGCLFRLSLLFSVQVLRTRISLSYCSRGLQILALSTPPCRQSHPTSIISGPKPNEHIARAGTEDTEANISTMADLQGRKIFKVFNQDFIVDERYTVTKELGQGAYGIVWYALSLLSEALHHAALEPGFLGARLC